MVDILALLLRASGRGSTPDRGWRPMGSVGFLRAPLQMALGKHWGNTSQPIPRRDLIIEETIMKRTKTKIQEPTDEVRGFLLQIAGDRETAEQTAAEWGVRIRVIEELTGKDEIFAVCPAADVREIRAWHAESVPHLQAGDKPEPGDLMRIEQPPEDVDTTFAEEERPHGGHGFRSITPRRVKFDEL